MVQFGMTGPGISVERRRFTFVRSVPVDGS